jgi:hypothetical protein
VIEIGTHGPKFSARGNYSGSNDKIQFLVETAFSLEAEEAGVFF